MIYRHRRFVVQKTALSILTIILIASCAAPAASPSEDAALLPSPQPVSVSSDIQPTLTPFQPLSAASPDPYLSLATLQPLPTYTPYPTKYVSGDGLPTPVDAIPSVDTTISIVNNPLTGLPVADPSLLLRRPLAIKIGNSPDYVRPQSGLTLADVVYEYYIEWGDTRFIAVFYSNDSPMVGPVRSGRFMDEHVARMYHAFLMFKGADPRELNYLHSTDLSDFLIIVGIGSCPPYFIGPYKRDSYNNVFFNTTKWAACTIKKGLDNSPQTISGGFFSTDLPESQLQATRIYSFYSVYSYNYWEYDPSTNNYFRYQESQDMDKGKVEAYAPLTDAQTELPVTAANVVTLFVPHIFANPYNAEDEVYNIDLIDFGKAIVFRDGLAIPAYWNRTEMDQPILLTNLDGTPIYMRPGRTFYQVMGTTSTYTQDGTNWRFKFQTP
ncbi:MAG: DUF3048 domain-containing protein [Anaerolineales bacterium]|nr:DUF3048 domain-containing protein [Anaerolineales bacterium]